MSTPLHEALGERSDGRRRGEAARCPADKTAFEPSTVARRWPSAQNAKATARDGGQGVAIFKMVGPRERALRASGVILAVTFFLAAITPAPVRADGPGDTPAAERFAFVPYAAAYSLETKQPDIVDPLVFVIAPHASPATGYFGIAHLPGIRNARMADDPMQPALDANGKPLGFDLQHWFAATGIVELVPEGTGRDRVTARFTNLVPNGRYSIFIARSAGALPLESRGTSFVAGPDGTGGIDAVAIAAPASGGTVLLVFHSDRSDGSRAPDRGEIGIYAHVQLAAPIP